jgi:hypothetical protein
MLGIEQIGDRPIGQQRLDRRQLARPKLPVVARLRQRWSAVTAATVSSP